MSRPNLAQSKRSGSRHGGGGDAPSEPRAAAGRAASNAAQLDDELAALRRQLRHSQSLASLGTVAAMVAHEFNNLMTPAVGYAKAALRHRDAELMVKALETTVSRAETALGMAERVLGMAADGPPRFAKVPIHDTIQGAVACLCRDLSKDGITLSLDVPDDLCVQGDARLLQQVFFNLLLNARDALQGRQGCISITAERMRDDVVVQVRDTGCGIEPGDLPHVFDTFFTTKRANEAGRRGGSGLGLTVCRDIIDEHGGSIHVDSCVKKSTTFTIRLPAA